MAVWKTNKKNPNQTYRALDQIPVQRKRGKEQECCMVTKINNLQREPDHFIVKLNVADEPQDFLNASVMFKSEQRINLGSSYRP